MKLVDRLFIRGLGVIVALILELGLFNNMAQAQVDITTRHQISYQGHLDLNGVPQNGSFDFILEIRDANDDVAWSEELAGVQVAAGTFSVILGQDTANNPLGDSVWQNDELYLAIQVKASADSSYTPLSGRQRILAVPYSVRSETAKSYQITGNLTADSADVTNQLTAGSAGVTNLTAGSATVTGALTAGSAGVTGILTAGGRRVITDLCLCVTNASTGGCGCCRQDGTTDWVEIGHWDVDVGGGAGRRCMQTTYCPDLDSGSGNYMTSLCARY